MVSRAKSRTQLPTRGSINLIQVVWKDKVPSNEEFGLPHGFGLPEQRGHWPTHMGTGFQGKDGFWATHMDLSLRSKDCFVLPT